MTPEEAHRKLDERFEELDRRALEASADIEEPAEVTAERHGLRDVHLSEPDPTTNGAAGRPDLHAFAGGRWRPAETVPTEDEYVEHLRRAALSTEQLKALPQPPWAIDGVLQRDSLAEVYGKPGSFKSFLAADWALCVSSGVDWRGRTVTPSSVLYIVTEGAPGMGARVTAWETHHAGRLADVGERHPVVWLPTTVDLGSSLWGRAVGEYAAEHGAGLVVFDTRARNTVGLEENSAKDMGLVVANLDAARGRCGACMLLVHHSNAFGDKSRGSTAVEGAVDTEILVKSVEGLVTVELTKQKNGIGGTQWKFRPLPVADSIVLDECDGDTAGEDISATGWRMLDELRAIHVDEPVSFTRWKEAGDFAKSTFSRQVKVLLERGFITKTGRAYEPVEQAEDRGTNDQF